MVSLMNAITQASAAPITGPKLDSRRVLAALVDVAIVAAGSVVILFAADALTADRSEVQGALSAVILGWALYYYFALESGNGQTVGKRLLKLRVVRADGGPVGMREVAVRTVLRVVDGVGGYIVGLIVMLATGQRRQRLGDLAAGTIIVDASSARSVPPAPAVEPVEDEPEAVVAPEAPPVPELRPFDPPAEPVMEDELVAEVEVVHEPVVEYASAPLEDEPVAEEPLPEISTPALDELARDVVAAQAEPEVSVEVVAVDVDVDVDGDGDVRGDVEVEDEDEDASAEVEDVPAEDDPAEEEVTFKSVETVSAIDLVMGAAAEEASPSEQDQDPEDPAVS